MIGVLCGLTAEANALGQIDGLKVFVGTDGLARLRQEPDLTGLLAWGTCGSLVRAIPVGVLAVGWFVRVGDDHFEPDRFWTTALNNALLRAHDQLGVDGCACCVLSGQLLLTPAERNAAALRWGAGVSEIESSLLIPIARERNLPLAVVRAVSDGWDWAIPDALATAMNAANGRVNPAAVLADLQRNHGDPAEIKALLRLVDGYTRAIDALAAFAAVGRAELQRIF